MNVQKLYSGFVTQPKVHTCIEGVSWNSHSTLYTDVGDLQNFVNVALATAAGGEDDFANDRLSSLRTVGTGFGSLIYELKEDTGFEELCKRCTSVWIAYTIDKNLPELLVRIIVTYVLHSPYTCHVLMCLQVSCNEYLEWYKSVKETQGSVEVTSFGQMRTIQSCGCYTIAGKRDVAMHSIHDVIQLTLQPKKGKELLRTGYSLDELRDLESKLVLITGSEAKNRAAVEQFLDVCTCICNLLCYHIFDFFTDPSLCVSHCRGADYAAASGTCSIHRMENGFFVSNSTCRGLTKACQGYGRRTEEVE